MNKYNSKPCKRVIKSDKSEKNDPSNELWWYNTFNELEKEYNIPIEERYEVLRQALPRELANKITAIYKCNDERRRRVMEEYSSVKSSDVELFHFSDETICDYTYHSKKKYEPITAKQDEESYDSKEGIRDEKVAHTDVNSDKIQLIPKKVVSSKEILGEEDEEKKICENIGKKNPYANFFNRPYDRAATWRPLPELSMEQLGLLEKAEAIKEMIAKNFVDWLNSIGGNDKNTLSVNSIKKMFQVGFHSHAATSLCVCIKEMPSVPDEVARAKYVKASSNRDTLYRHLHRDIETFEKTKDKIFAFGKLLPIELRMKAVTENIALKWLHGVKVPQELDDMSAVWKGITNLRSTRGFCNWLLNHSDIPRPSYLESMGLLLESQKNKRYSLDSRKMLNEIQ